jgi:hypothetical protein
VVHASVIHDEQKNVCVRNADLKSEAAAFHLHGCGSRPATGTAAHGETSAILSADDEAGFLHAGNDHDTTGLIQEILGHAFVVRMHHGGHQIRGRRQSIVCFDFSVGREGTCAESTCHRKNRCECSAHFKFSPAP